MNDLSRNCQTGCVCVVCLCSVSIRGNFILHNYQKRPSIPFCKFRRNNTAFSYKLLVRACVCMCFYWLTNWAQSFIELLSTKCVQFASGITKIMISFGFYPQALHRCVFSTVYSSPIQDSSSVHRLQPMCVQYGLLQPYIGLFLCTQTVEQYESVRPPGLGLLSTFQTVPLKMYHRHVTRPRFEPTTLAILEQCLTMEKEPPWSYQLKMCLA